MPVKKVILIPNGHRSRVDAISTATLCYRVVCDKGDLPVVAEQAVPYSRGSYLKNDPERRVCSAIDVERVQDSDGVYDVRVEFTKNTVEATDPLDRLYRPSIDFEQTTEPIYEIANKGIVNSAGCSFDPPIEVCIFDPIITIVQNVAKWNPAASKTFINCVNLDAWGGADEGELKIVGWTTSPQIENGVEFYQDVVRIAQRPNREIGGKNIRGWDRLILDEGRYTSATVFTQNDDGGTDVSDLSLIKDKRGDPVVDPVKLNGAGLVLNSKTQATGGTNFVVSDDGLSVFRVVPPIKLIAFSLIKLKFKT